jgi:hypothetical protein
LSSFLRSCVRAVVTAAFLGFGLFAVRPIVAESLRTQA